MANTDSGDSRDSGHGGASSPGSGRGGSSSSRGGTGGSRGGSASTGGARGGNARGGASAGPGGSTSTGSAGRGSAQTGGRGGSVSADRGGRATGTTGAQGGRSAGSVAADRGGRVSGSTAASRGGRVGGSSSGAAAAAAASAAGRFGDTASRSPSRSSAARSSSIGRASERQISDRIGGAFDATRGTGAPASGGRTGAASPQRSSRNYGRATASLARSAQEMTSEASKGGRVAGSGAAAAAAASAAGRFGDAPAPSSRNYGRGFATAAREAQTVDAPARSSRNYGQRTASLAREAQRVDTPAPSSRNYGIGLAAAARAAEDRSMAQHGAWDGFLDTIKSAEAQRAPNPRTGKVDPYNGLVSGRGTPTHADLTDMTIAEVQAYQSGMISRGHLSSAVGAYQMLSKTLAEAATVAGMDPKTTRFSRSTQDALAMSLANNKRGTQAARSPNGLTPASYAAALAQEWAGFATRSGRSYYAGDGMNHATISYDRVLGAATDLVESGAIGQGRGARPGRITAPSREPVATALAESRPRAPTSAQGAIRAATAGRFRDTYLADASAPASPAAPTAKPTTGKKRSTTDRVIAGAIDVGVGLLPGIGTAAGMYGLAAGLTGMPSIGEMTLNLRDRNQITGARVAGGGRGTGNAREVVSRPAAPRALQVAELQPEEAVVSLPSFADRYLSWRDDVERPSASQKWGGIGPNDTPYSL